MLVLVDDFNWLFRPSVHWGLQYADLKKLNHQIPPYHMALARLFMKFDGHMIARGFKAAAVSTFSIVKHNFEPEKINFPDHVGVRL